MFALAPAFLAAGAALMPTGGGAVLPSDQAYHGLVNGQDDGVAVYVSCATGLLGVNQTAEVQPGGPGQTGPTPVAIQAYFYDAGGSPLTQNPAATIHDFNTPAPLTTAAPLPCSGTGSVRFFTNGAFGGQASDSVAIQFAAAPSGG
jgi:hypothetical protein